MSVLDRSVLNLAVVRAPLHDLARVFDTYPPMRVRSYSTPFVFPTQSYRREKQAPPMLLWSPRCSPALTAFMPSVSSGDYFFAAYCARFKLEVIDVQSSTRATNELNQMTAHNRDGGVRVVQALHDSPRWVFHQEGAPLSFERVAQYQARRIKDRLTRETVFSYLEAWGAPVRNPDFWLANGEARTFLPKSAGL
jgi:hypothetical protein